MFERFYKLTSQEVFNFSPVEGFEELLDLTARNLWDLCDIAVRFGALKYDNFGKLGVFFRHNSLRVEMYNFTDNGLGGSAGFMVGKHRPEKKFQSTSEGAFLVSLLNGMHIIWDKGHSVADVQTQIYEIEKLSYELDMVIAGRRAVLY